ncbi:MAG: biosynthetic arginine decarboxylase [Thiofilum sp.]|uniref:biosynthetic arginine decarboxylase n=1 Tax=Thiofilum sp. TaxID=2212733 RepID=UPI0025CFD0BE|nr:biosynthetic arginine decarboxylase [Thiofilum sp.]MBK8452646.1 biosynthetic arginine decarboxylase [Thiofilum sp.]
MTTWNLEAARRLYGIQHWGNGYFDINEAGHVMMQLPNQPERFVDVYRLATQLKADGLRWPVLIRFTDIVHDRVQRLQKAFNQAIASTGQNSRYTAIYPIKVNQQQSVVSHILAGGGEQVGLEAGSKPELVAVLGSAPSGSTIICNGYKDREYLRLALIGRQMGHRIFIVVEKPSELTETLEESAKLGIEPLFGVRVRLYSLGKGKWQNTGGEKSKFGLSAAQALHMLEVLKQANKLECLQLLHFHMGSQIANIRDIQSGMLEASHYFAELNRLGAPIRVVDVGGGLGVDYEGSRSRSECSINYTMQEYANTIVRSVHSVCVEYDLPLPDFITEAGRAMTAHHAVLITNVIDTDPEQPESAPRVIEPEVDAPLVLHNIYRLYEQLHHIPASEIYHDAEFLIGEVHALYARGVIHLRQRAQAEETYRAIGLALLHDPNLRSGLSASIDSALQEKLANKYFCNFSLFQSMPDAWAIKQLFPIMPLHRLQEAPSRRAVLQDLTCDSDGAVHTYVENGQLTSTLAVHELSDTEPYLLGIFMVGAYQEILGDLHNLFGDTDSINVELLSKGEYRLQEPESGDTIAELLGMVHFEPKDLLAQCRKKLAATVNDPEQLKALQREIEASLTDYTYLED